MRRGERQTAFGEGAADGCGCANEAFDSFLLAAFLRQIFIARLEAYLRLKDRRQGHQPQQRSTVLRELSRAGGVPGREGGEG